MTTPFPILQIPDDAPEDIEQMGSKEKFWFRQNDERWLFKYPRPGTGEHWAEKVVAEVAALLSIPVARVELAKYQDNLGSATLSFADRTQGKALIHGNEILAALVTGYDKDKWRHQSDHTLDAIIASVNKLFPPPRRKIALEVLAGYVVLDALVGNVDRHHENWGVVLAFENNKLTQMEVAPSFDHASSLGRELLPQRCGSFLQNPDNIKRYMQNGHGGIFINTSDAKGASPLRLALEAMQKYPDYFTIWLNHLAGLDMDQVECIINSIPEGWISADNRKFAYSFLRIARQALLEGKQ